MPVVKINTGGRAKSASTAKAKTTVKSGATKAKPKTAAKPKTTARTRTAAKATTAAKPRTRGAAAKSAGSKAKATTAKKTTTTKRNVVSTGKAEQRTIDSQVKKLSKIGADRKKAEAAHKALVDKTYEAAQEALGKGVPTGVVAESLQISRQWLYKIGNYSGRS
jgi:hypothetical protein